MTNPSPPNPSEASVLDAAEALRRKRQEMHEQVDNWIDHLEVQLGVTQIKAEPVHSIGISFEPGIRFDYVPANSSEVETGIYEARKGQQVEVLPSVDPGKVHFEIVDMVGQPTVHLMDEPLFHQLFDTGKVLKRGSTSGYVYGLHPTNKSIALRYNPDGTITSGKFGEQGQFIPAE